MHDLEGAAGRLLFGLPESHFPVTARIADRCTTLLILTDELLGEFTTEDANQLMAIEPVIRRIYGDIEAILQRIAQ